MKALYPPPAARLRVRPFLPLMALAAATILATIPGKALAKLTQASITASPDSASVLIADGGCRYAITGKALDGDANLVPNTTLHFALTCSPSGNATLSATTVSTSTGQGTVYATGSSHCTISVSVWADDGARETSTVSTGSRIFVTGHFDETLGPDNGSGSGSWSTGGVAVPEVAPWAFFNLNGHSTYSDDTPAEGSASQNLDGYNGVTVECASHAGDNAGLGANSAQANATSQVVAQVTRTWVPDQFSNSHWPLGYTLYTDNDRGAIAHHTNLNGTAEGEAAFDTHKVTATATGAGSVTDDEWSNTTHTESVAVLGNITNASITTKATASSSSSLPPGETSSSGDATGSNNASFRFEHAHVNP